MGQNRSLSLTPGATKEVLITQDSIYDIFQYLDISSIGLLRRLNKSIKNMVDEVLTRPIYLLNMLNKLSYESATNLLAWYQTTDQFKQFEVEEKKAIREMREPNFVPAEIICCALTKPEKIKYVNLNSAIKTYQEKNPLSAPLLRSLEIASRKNLNSTEKKDRDILATLLENPRDAVAIINLENVYLWSVKLDGVDLRLAKMSGANLSGADLSNAKLSGANLSGANLSDAKLSGANLSGANLSNAEFRGANLKGANLRGAILKGVKLYDTKLQQVILSGCNLTKIEMGSTNLNLSDANLNNAILTDAKLTGANLSRANLQQTKLIRTKMTQVNLTGADLSNAKFYKTFLWGANLSGANLSGTNLRDANLSYTNLDEANFGTITLNPNVDKKTLPAVDQQNARILSAYLKKYKNARQRLHNACNNYLQHTKTHLTAKQIEEKISVFVRNIPENHVALFDHDEWLKINKDRSDTIVNLYKRLKFLDKFAKSCIKKYGSKTPHCQQFKKEYSNLMGDVKWLTVKGLHIILDDQNLKDTQALHQCDDYLNWDKRDILFENRQSLSERMLKVLSVISILVGVGIFTTAGLVINRLYATRSSINFFKSVGKNLYEDFENLKEKVELPYRSNVAYRS